MSIKPIIKILFFLFLGMLCKINYAQKGTIKFISQGLKDGLSQSSINDILQDKHGFMWFGTQDGLNRYDGYKFTVFKQDLNDSTSLSDNFVNCLFEDKNGTTWIGTEGGLNYYNAESESFTYYQYQGNTPNSLSNNNVKDICEDVYGNLWVATLGGGLNKFDRQTKSFTTFTHDINQSNSLISNQVLSLFNDNKGNLWIGTEGGGLNLYELKTNKLISYSEKGSLKKIPLGITTIIQKSDNFLWIGASNGVFLFNVSSKKFESAPQLPSQVSWESIKNVNRIYKDNSSIIWIATTNGLYRYESNTNLLNKFEANRSLQHSLTSNLLLSIYEDLTGSLWFGTDNGINHFDRTKQNFYHFQSVPNHENTLNSNVIWSILEDQNLILWVGTNKGLNRIDRNTGIIEHFSKEFNNNLKDAVVYSLFKDHNSILWIGTDNGLFYYNSEKKNFKKFPSNNPAAINLNSHRIYTFFEDKNKNLWIGTKNGLFIIDASRKKIQEHLHNDSNTNTISNNIIRNIGQDFEENIWLATNSAGLNKAVVSKINGKDSVYFMHYSYQDKSLKGANNNALHFSKNGIIWIGSYGGGLYKFNPKTGKFIQFTEKNGLSNNVIYGILEDANGNLWLSTNKGISNFNPRSNKFQNYYESDGLQSDEFNTGAHFKSTAGELFFGGINGLSSFFPDKIQINKIPPTVVITDLRIFNKRVNIGDRKSPLSKSIIETSVLSLTHKQGVVTFEFAALHYSSPDKNQYTYIMEGFDEDWNFVSDRRQATYTNLDPGEYKFRVKAANSDGVWNEEGASINVTILPPFWKTWWFRSIAIACIFTIILGTYYARINVIKLQKISLEKQVRERTAEILDKTKKIENQHKLLEEEKEKVEKLLLNMLPQETVDELKTKGKASARHYRMASIMFTDFRGFTKIAEKVRPKDLVAELDKCFIKFDEIIEKYNLEKIKTIGDSYMCAGGLPVRNKSNPIDIVLAALEIQRYITDLKKEKIASGEQYWDLRIGINTGELIAGVVGIKRFAYDIWGDSVNIASRMEMHSEIGAVNISGSTYKHIKDFFECTYRGKVLAKNKGEIDMYFVNRIKPKLSADEDGILPNILFEEKIFASLYSKINYDKAKNAILSKLEKELPKDLSYHAINHTIDVHEAAEKLAIEENLRGDDLILVKTAALLHDAGFITQYEKNEPIAVELAKEILPNFGYTNEHIEIITGMIMATQIPQSPKNIYEEILCDADLDYLGRPDFYEISNKLKKEFKTKGRVKTDFEFDTLQIKFLEKHVYFTKTSINLRREEKRKRLAEIKERHQAIQS